MFVCVHAHVHVCVDATKEQCKNSFIHFKCDLIINCLDLGQFQSSTSVSMVLILALWEEYLLNGKLVQYEYG